VPSGRATFRSEVAEARVPVTLDLRGLTFMDSRGVHMQVSFDEQARARGFPLTVACGESVQSLLT